MSVTHIDRINATSGFVCTRHIPFIHLFYFFQVEQHRAKVWVSIALISDRNRCSAVYFISFLPNANMQIENFFPTSLKLFFSIYSRCSMSWISQTDTKTSAYNTKFYPTNAYTQLFTPHWSNDIFLPPTLITFIYHWITFYDQII